MFYIFFMTQLNVQIVRYVDSSFPGWVECMFVDSEGRCHTLRDKVPIFTVELLNEKCPYPRPGEVACEMLERFRDNLGNDVARITLQRPYAVESVEGANEFVVALDNLRD